eukprot:5098628-Prorocentrum_lima.AAC.1
MSYLKPPGGGGPARVLARCSSRSMDPVPTVRAMSGDFCCKRAHVYVICARCGSASERMRAPRTWV